MKRDDHANINQKKVKGAVLILEKADFKTRKITRNEELHYIMIKGSLVQEDLRICN